jgi:hypothetical protein
MSQMTQKMIKNFVPASTNICFVERYLLSNYSIHVKIGDKSNNLVSIQDLNVYATSASLNSVFKRAKKHPNKKIAYCLAYQTILVLTPKN